jgi:hypothetical protein
MGVQNFQDLKVLKLIRWAKDPAGENEKLTSKVLKLGLAQIWLKEGFQLLLVRKRFDGKTTKIKKIIYLFKMAVGLHFIL